MAQLPDDTDTPPLSIFASALHAPVSATTPTRRAFFGSGTRAAAGRRGRRPADRLDRAARRQRSRGRRPCSPSRARSRWRRAQSVTLPLRLRLRPPEADPAAAGPLPTRAPTRSDQSETQWAAWLPKAELGAPVPRGSRASSSGTPTRCARTRPTRSARGYHILSQGGYYQYFFGFQGPSATRSSTCCR